MCAKRNISIPNCEKLTILTQSFFFNCYFCQICLCIFYSKCFNSWKKSLFFLKLLLPLPNQKVKQFCTEFNVFIQGKNNPWTVRASVSEAMEHSFRRDFGQERDLYSVRSRNADTGNDCLGLGNLTLYRKIKEQGNKFRFSELAWHLGLADWIYCFSG